MTVKELVELLQKEDPEAIVLKTEWISNDDGTSWEVEREISYITTAEVKKGKNSNNQVVLLH